MAKKDFAGALDATMQNMAAQPTAPKAPEAKKETAAAPKAAAKRGRPARDNADMVQRATFVINKELLQELKRIACVETGRQYKRVTITEVLEDALRKYIDKYNKQK